MSDIEIAEVISLSSPSDTIKVSQSPKQREALFSNIKQFYTISKFTDVTFIVDEKKFYCHKVILAASSRYFSTMFSNCFKESDKDIIAIKDICSDAFEKILKFIYGEDIDLGVENCDEILRTASLLAVEDAIEACSTYLVNNLSLGNCVNCLQLAHQHNLQALQKSTERYIFAKFGDVAEQESFFGLPYDVMCSLFASDNVLTSDEVVLFRAGKSYLERQGSPRLAADLLRHVRYGNISTEQLAGEVFTFAPMYEVSPRRERGWKHTRASFQHAELRHLVTRALQFPADSLKRVLCSEAQFQPRGARGLLVLGGRGADDQLSQRHTFVHYQPLEMDELVAYAVPNSSVCRENHCAVSVNNHVIVLGGDTRAVGTVGEAATSAVSLYAAAQDQWRPLPDMTDPRAGFVALALQDAILVCGGAFRGEVSSRVERLDLTTLTWSQQPNMPNRLHFHAGATLGHHVAVCGGSSGYHVVHGDTYMLDTSGWPSKTTPWVKVASLLKERKGHGASAYGGRMYVNGGTCQHRCSLDSEVYDPLTDQWSVLSTPFSLRKVLQVTKDDEIVIMAARSERSGAFFYYQPRSGEWEQCSFPTIRVQKHALAVATRAQHCTPDPPVISID